MAKKISSKDIFEGKPLQPLIEDAKKTVIELKKLETGLKQIAQIAKNDLKGLKLNSFSNVSKASKAVNDVDKSFKGLNETTKERIKLQGQLKRANSDSIQKNEEIRLQLVQQKKTNKELARQKLIDLGVLKDEKKIKSDLIAQKKRESEAIKKIAKDEKDLIRTKKELLAQRKRERKQAADLKSAYKQESKTLNDLRKRLKDLSVAGRTGGKVFKGLQIEVTRLDAKLKKADAAAGQFQRNVGNYPKGLKGAIGSLKNFAGALGITAGVAGLVRVMGNAVNIAKDFEQGNANLAAVLGKTKDQIGALTTDAKRLGAATAFSATQVSGLQVEFAKLGFSEKEILAATEATLSLAAATGSDLGEAAAIAGATLGGFGLGAEETQRVVDVMAKSFSTSALDIEKFKESMKNAAPAAKAVGISVEQTTALLGTLANAGISGSKAGNNLKTSFINLNKAGLTLEEGLEKVANSEDKLGTAAELVGKNAAASFLVLSEGVDVTKELTKGLQNAGGAAEKMAKEQLNTLEGSLTILNSAWEGFVLGLLSGDGAFSSISRSIVETTTSLLGMLTPSEELADTWFAQRDAVNELEKDLNPLLDRYDELKKQTELTKDEQVELDVIIQKVAQDVPTAITAFDKYGKALDISTGAAKKFIQQQKDLLALDNAEAISEQEDKIVDLNRSVERLNKTYELRDGVLKRVDRSIKTGAITVRDASAAEIASFTATGQALKDQIILREAKIARLKGEKTEIEKLADAEKDLTQAELDAAAAAEEEAAKKKAKADKKAREDKKRAEELAKELLEFEKLKEKQFLDFLDAKEKAENEFFESQLEKEQQEIRAVEEKYFDLIQQGEDYNEIALANGEELVVDLTQLKEDEQSQIAAIEKKYRDAEAAENAKLMAELEAQAQAEIDLAKKTAQDLADLEKKKREEQLKAAEKYLDLTSEAFSDEIDKEEKEQNEAIKRREESVALQQERAANGLENTLAFEKEQLAKAELERARTAEKRAQQEEALALAQGFLNAFAARAKDDPDTAAAKALTDVILAKALSETVAGAFAEGVEDFQGEGTGTSDSNLIRFSHGESVVTAKGTKENKGLATAMNNGDVGGWFANNMMLTPLSSDKNYDSFGILANEIKEIKQAIKNRPTSQTNLDNMGNVLQSTYKNGVRNTVKYLNSRPRI